MAGSATRDPLTGSPAEGWRENGIVVARGVYDPDRAMRLASICERILEQWRVCSPENGKPGGTAATVMRHLNHPGYFTEETRDEFIDLMDAAGDAGVLDLLGTIFDDRPLFRTTSLFFTPLEDHRDGNWHRDSQFHAPDVEDEKRLLAERAHPAGGVQMQIALVPSDDVEYVPASHRRWDTEEEYHIRRADAGANNRSNDMPGAVRVALEPGDAVCFNPMGLHRGRYHTDRPRLTFMLTYTKASAPMYDYFSHQPWFLEDGYLDGLSPAAAESFAFFRDHYAPKWREHPDGPPPRR